MKPRIPAVLLTLAITAPTAVVAQVYHSTIVGIVTDSTGATVPGAKISAQELSTNVTSESATQAGGDYRVTQLRPGMYRVQVTAAGFKKYLFENVELKVGGTVRLNAQLEVGAQADQVTVQSEAPLVQTEASNRGSNVNAREIEALPLSSRNIYDVAFLTAGATKNGDPGESWSLSVAGLGLYSSQFYVDGAGATSFGATGIGGTAVIPAERVNIDSIQEYKIDTSNFSAEYGLHAGAQVSIATKSGTNSLHGSLFEFVRNDKFSARNYFAGAGRKPPLRWNNFGGQMGYRIIPNKFFFTFSYESARERRPVTRAGAVPTANELRGDFTPGTGSRNTAAIFDPTTSTSATQQRTPFPNNQVPQSRWNSIAQKYLALNPWPQPNSRTYPNFLYNGARRNDYTTFAGRLDYNLSSKDVLYFRMGQQANPVFEPGTVPIYRDSVGDANTSYTPSFNWNHIFNDHMLNEFRWSMIKVNKSLGAAFGLDKNYAKEFGYENGDRLKPEAHGCPAIYISQIEPICDVYRSETPNNTMYITDNFSFRRGLHNIKFGALHMRYSVDSIFQAYPGGTTASFSGLYTSQVGDTQGGQPMADFLLGALGGVGVYETTAFTTSRVSVYQFYVQDDWKATPKLTLQLGLRWDLNLPATSVNGKSYAWIEGFERRTGQQQVFPANAKQPLEQALGGTNLGFPYRIKEGDRLNTVYYRNWGPRVGFAYRPFGGVKTVIRGGYGIYYDIGRLAASAETGRPFVISGSTPPPVSPFAPAPYRLGQVPTLTAQWRPGERYRAASVLFPGFVDPLVQQWNLTIQRQFAGSVAVDVAYVGHKLDRGVGQRRVFNESSPPGYLYHYPDGSSFTVTDSLAVPERAKYPQLGRATTYFNETFSIYHAAQINVVKNFSHGLQFRSGYTFSKNLGFSADWWDRQDEWGGRTKNRLNYDTPHLFFATYVWEVPFGKSLKGAARQVVHGWQLSGATTFGSGKLFTPVNQRAPFVGDRSSTHPDRLADGNLPESQRTPQKWFDLAAFVTPTTPRYGTSAANFMQADGIANWDITLAKRFQIREGHFLQFRMEAFNAFNHPTFGVPQFRVGNAAYGVVASTENTARDVQFGLKYQF
ncbi:MAG: carboxypeptidase regulatory-like domain-containing protein [Bryobacteraceae bacterium]